jgi:tol-pal system protein YbgF
MTRFTTKGSQRLPFVLRLALLAVILPGAGCADVTGESVRQDVAQLRQELNALTLSTHRTRSDTEAVLNQLQRVTRDQGAELTRQQGALAARVDSLATDTGRLSSRLDEISQRLEALSRQAMAPRITPSPPSPVPAPARPVPPPATPAPSAPGTPAPPPPPAPVAPLPAPAGPRSSTEGPTPEEAYQAAYLDFSKGNYPLAISGFREFVRRYPDSPLAGNAQYWVGESYFSLARASAGQGQAEKSNQEMEQSIQEFRKVALNHPRTNKVPTAIYKEALALLELKQTKAAQSRLKYLLDHFPQSEEAPLAKERLASITEQ